jgi:hypothetical protein
LVRLYPIKIKRYCYVMGTACLYFLMSIHNHKWPFLYNCWWSGVKGWEESNRVEVGLPDS